MPCILSTQQLTKSYDRGRVQALRGITLTIDEGEIFGLIGPDGAGKTTLFRLLTSLLLPDSGTMCVDGLDPVKQYAQLRQRIGYMPGRFSLYQDLTVEENLQFFAATFGTSLDENYALIGDIYEQIAPFKHRLAGKLSGGMKQKLALCCALIHAPRLLFLDEPTTGIDPVSRRELWSLLHRLNQDYGMTIIASSPYREEVMACHRIALMHEGQVRAVGRPAEVLPAEVAVVRQPIAPSPHWVIEVENLTKQFGTFKAVDGISFRVREGEIFGFLGANGAGKTTAMRMLCGLSQPTAGQARVAGFDISSQHEQVKFNIGYMSQKFALYDDLTVEENMRLFGGIYQMAAVDIVRRTEELLDTLGLQTERRSLVGSLPLGWKQKLAFSVATIHSPKIVFLDEPTGGVDAETRRQFWQLIDRAAQQGMTIFVTTHYMDEADYCDRVSIMVDGRIAALDTPAALKRQYATDSMYDVFFALARKAQRGS